MLVDALNLVEEFGEMSPSFGKGQYFGHRANCTGFCPIWWATRDSNPDGLPHTPLKRARLPVPPAALAATADSTDAGCASISNLGYPDGPCATRGYACAAVIGLAGLLRFKWTYLVVGLILGGIGVFTYLSAHPSKPVEIDGTEASYVEVTKNNAYDHN